MDLREMPQVPGPQDVGGAGANDGRGAAAGRHPWETARAEFFVRLICEHLPRDRPSTVLDVGAGDGYFARQLLAALPAGSAITCLDSGYSDELLERLSHGGDTRIELTRARPERVFDAVVMLDVMEHVIDDHGFLKSIAAQSLKPGGAVVISVPAHPSLYTQHDVDLGHHRRYTRPALAALLASAQLEVIESGGLFSSLLLARGAAKALELARGVQARPAPAGLADQIATEVGTWQGGSAITRAIHGVLAVDAAIGQKLARTGIPIPGLSVWSLSRRA
jgi:2-polyprenyl-3-methyl-5-hydroxy-6-metoxy-1,4-benzoquinol methylase